LKARASLPAIALAAVAVLAVLYAGLCKALLFHGLEYFHTDFFSFLEMSRSLFQYGELLRDNAYGHDAAIHNFYLLLAFAPLTLPLGAYGLILGLVLLHALAVLRVALAPSLDLPGRVAVLGACLSPIAYGVFDNSLVGFHPELCYPPLALLLALDLREGRSRRAVLAAALVVLVKEDGAVLCASILIAFFALRLRALGSAAPAHVRRRVVAAAVRSLAVLGLVFVAGMVLLWAMGRALPEGQLTAESRVLDSLRNVVRAVEGRGLLRDNLRWGLVGYLVVGLLTLLTLGRRLPRGLALLVASSPLLVSVLVVASGTYRFRYMLWPHRLAALYALAIACVALAAPAAAWVRRRAVARVLSLVVLSWTLQVVVLDRAQGYSPWARLWAPALMKGEGTRAAGLPPAELRFLRCLAGRLPPGLPVSSTGDLHPVFHRQSVVFEALEANAWHPPRLRVVPASSVPRDPTFCRDPGVGALAADVECALVPLVAGCRD
jgi:Predicted membrane protein (DUF2079)